MLINILHCTGPFPTVKNYPQPSVLRIPDLWVRTRDWSETSPLTTVERTRYFTLSRESILSLQQGQFRKQTSFRGCYQ